MSDAPSSYTIRPKARPGDAWRVRMLQWLGKPRAPVSQPRFRALIYKPERLGDFFLAVESIRALVRYWGEDHTALVVSPECAAIASEEFPALVKFVLPLHLGAGGWNIVEALALRRELALYSCENLVCLRHHRQPLSSAALGWIPAGRRWGFTEHPWMPSAVRVAEEGLFERRAPYPWPGRSGIPSEIQAHAELLAQITGVSAEAAQLLPKIQVNQARGAQPVLYVVPWGSGGIKNLTGELILQIILRLAPARQFTVRIIAESKRSAELKTLIHDLHEALPEMDIAHEPTADVPELRLILAQASAVLSADTYPAHLAIAMDKPVAILNTGALPGVFGPWSRSDKQRWFTREMECWGCGWSCIHAKAICLLEIAPDEVARFLSPHLTA